MVGRSAVDRAGRGDLRALLARRPPEGPAVTFVELAGLVLLIALGVYLLVALLRPEKFG